MTSRRATAAEADRIARQHKVDGMGEWLPTWDDLRKFCDFATDQDMTASQLDRLTDMVERRIGQ